MLHPNLTKNYVLCLKYGLFFKLFNNNNPKTVVKLILIKSGKINGSTTRLTAFEKSACVISIKPITPPINRETSPKRFAKNRRTAFCFLCAMIDVTNARTGKKTRKPAVGPKKA